MDAPFSRSIARFSPRCLSQYPTLLAGRDSQERGVVVWAPGQQRCWLGAAAYLGLGASAAWSSAFGISDTPGLLLLSLTFTLLPYFALARPPAWIVTDGSGIAIRSPHVTRALLWSEIKGLLRRSPADPEGWILVLRGGELIPLHLNGFRPADRSALVGIIEGRTRAHSEELATTLTPGLDACEAPRSLKASFAR